MSQTRDRKSSSGMKLRRVLTFQAATVVAPALFTTNELAWLESIDHERRAALATREATDSIHAARPENGTAREHVLRRAGATVSARAALEKISHGTRATLARARPSR